MAFELGELEDEMHGWMGGACGEKVWSWDVI